MAKDVANKDDLTKILEEAGSKLVIIDFYATWCAPCKVIAPLFDEMATNDDEVVVVKVNINECEDIAEEYGISAMPTFIFLREKKILGTYVGANVSKFKDTVAQYKATRN